VAVAEVEASSNKGVLTRFAEAGLVRGYPTLLLFRCAVVIAHFACTATEQRA
jgi:hypothetical protein